MSQYIYGKNVVISRLKEKTRHRSSLLIRRFANKSGNTSFYW